jgi:hypothetical protein
MAVATTLALRKARLSDDRKYLRTTIPVSVGGWTVTAPVRLDARSIDALLSDIGRHRGRMADQPPLEPAAGAAAMAVADPYWRVSRSALTAGPCIGFRHPGFGWLQFELTTDEARKLAHDLLALVEAPR